MFCVDGFVGSLVWVNGSVIFLHFESGILLDFSSGILRRL